MSAMNLAQDIFDDWRLLIGIAIGVLYFLGQIAGALRGAKRGQERAGQRPARPSRGGAAGPRAPTPPRPAATPSRAQPTEARGVELPRVIATPPTVPWPTSVPQERPVSRPVRRPEVRMEDRRVPAPPSALPRAREARPRPVETLTRRRPPERAARAMPPVPATEAPAEPRRASPPSLMVVEAPTGKVREPRRTPLTAETVKWALRTPGGMEAALLFSEILAPPVALRAGHLER